MNISPAASQVSSPVQNSQNTAKAIGSQSLGKEDFLKILITQLQNQDPSKPMEDKEFIAQMAQFSSLEQITNMSSQFANLSSAIKSSQAMNLVGRNVEVINNDASVSGMVEAVMGGNYPQVMINGVYYDYENVVKVME